MLDSGAELERLAHKFAWSLGYLPKSRIRFWFEEVREDTTEVRYETATDLDVMGFMYDGFLHETRLLIDCKHEAEGTLTQILRAKGLQAIFDIDEVILLRTKVGAQHRAFADANGLSLVKVNDFVEMVDEFEDLGSFTGAAFRRAEELEGGLPRDFNKRVSFPLENSFLTKDPFDRIKQLVAVIDIGLRQIPEKEIQSRTISPRKWVIFRAFAELARTTAEMASHLVGTPVSQTKYDLQIRLAGDVEFKRTFLKKLQSSDMTKESKPPETVALSDLAPTYTNHIYEAAKVAIRGSRRVQVYLRCLDLVLHESILADREVNMGRAADLLRLKKKEIQELASYLQNLVGALSSSPGAPETFASLV